MESPPGIPAGDLPAGAPEWSSSSRAMAQGGVCHSLSGQLRGIEESEEDHCLAAAAALQHLAWGASPHDDHSDRGSTICWEELERSCQELDASHIQITSLDLSCVDGGAEPDIVYNFQVGPSSTPARSQRGDDLLGPGTASEDGSPLVSDSSSAGHPRSRLTVRSSSLQGSALLQPRSAGRGQMVAASSELCLSAMAADSPEMFLKPSSHKAIVPSASTASLDALLTLHPSRSQGSQSGPQGNFSGDSDHQQHQHHHSEGRNLRSMRAQVGSRTVDQSLQPIGGTEVQARRLLDELLDPKLKASLYRSYAAPPSALQTEGRESGMHRLLRTMKTKCGVVFVSKKHLT